MAAVQQNAAHVMRAGLAGHDPETVALCRRLSALGCRRGALARGTRGVLKREEGTIAGDDRHGMTCKERGEGGCVVVVYQTALVRGFCRWHSPVIFFERGFLKYFYRRWDQGPLPPK